VEDGAAVRVWCQRQLGAEPVEELFRAGHLSLVVGLRLADDRRVVVKARPAAERVAGCVAAQRALALAGFPCPRPLAGPQRLDGLLVTAEELVAGGEQLTEQADAAVLFAGLLAELVRLAPPPWAVPPLGPSPPWVAWDRQGAGLWPAADDLAADLNRHRGPGWLDETAMRIRARLAGVRLAAVVGHGDWESQNIRWHGRHAWVVHDWDSVVAQPEAAVAGQAAAVWPAAGGPGQAASVAQTEQFLAAYAQARGRGWTHTELHAAWAAGLWVRCFNAKKDAVVGGGPQLDRLAGEVAARARNAGI
jgi:Phosphotransferase enzyme family